MALVSVGCVADNPAFGDGGTTRGAGGDASSATSEANPSGTSQADGSQGGSTAQAVTSANDSGDTTTAWSSSATQSDTERPGDWLLEDYRFRLVIKFIGRDAPLEGFVTPVELEFGQDTLDQVDPAQMQFVDVLTGSPLAVEFLLFQREKGTVRVWLRLPLWAADELTLVHAYFDPDAEPVEHASPWEDYAAVWHMDEVTGNVTPDAAHGRDAALVPTLTGNPLSTGAGVVGPAVEFNGIDHRLGAELDGGLDDSTFLVSAWTRANAAPGEGTPILSRGQRWGDARSDTEWMMGFGPGVLRGRVHDSSSLASTQTTAPAPGEWVHHAFLVTDTSLQLFRNGNAPSTGQLEGGFEHVLEELSIGGYASEAPGWEGRVFDGNIDEVWWRVGGDVDAAWVSNLYLTQLEPETTFEYGGVEAL